MDESIYSKINSIIVWSDYFKVLSDKMDIYDNRSRIIRINDISELTVKYAKEHGLNEKLSELVVNSCELGFWQYSEVGYKFLKEKYKDFCQSECSIAILKSIIEEYNNLYNTDIVIPDELIVGIECSFNKEYAPTSKEGVMICMINESYDSNKVNKTKFTQKQESKCIENLEYVWNIHMSDCEITNENIANNILKYSETELREMGNFYEE